MGRRQVLDMDVITQPGAVGRRVVRAEDGHMRATADRCLAGDFDEQCGLRCRLADRSRRLAAGDVEISQTDIAGSAGGGEIAQHPFRHEL